MHQRQLPSRPLPPSPVSPTGACPGPRRALGRPLARLALTGALGLTLAGGFAPAALPGPVAAQEPPATPSAAPGMSIADVVARVSPAVVTVLNEQRQSQVGTADPEPVGSGTGFIIDQQGHIVTNNHVVQGGEAFEVIFADGEKRQARLIGRDDVSDLAVIQVDGQVPATVSFGNSGALRVGEPVIAVGSPLGAFTNTVTEGIVSALNRTFPGSAYYTNLIQHDAAINPGNSGGPLFNAAGEVVGVNTLGIPQAQGIFFAIPASTVQEVVTQLIEAGQVTYPFLGVTTYPVSESLAAQLELPADSGVLVLGPSLGQELFGQPAAAPEGPAAAAGLQEGDIILAINGQPINEQNPFVEVLFQFKPGDDVTLTVQRGDQQLELPVALAERPAPR